MKKNLVTLLILASLTLFSCNKEEILAEADLNGNGTKEIIQGKYLSNKNYALYYFDGGNAFDPSYIVQGLNYTPINPRTWDFNQDGFPEVVYGMPTDGGITDYVVDNDGGDFSEPEEMDKYLIKE